MTWVYDRESQMKPHIFDNLSDEELEELQTELTHRLARSKRLQNRVETIIEDFDFKTCSAMVKHFNWTSEYKGPVLPALKDEARECIKAAMKCKETFVAVYNHKFVVIKERDTLRLMFAPTVYHSLGEHWSEPLTSDE